MSKKVDLQEVRAIPILDVAERLGMQTMREGSAWAMREEGTKNASSLVLFPGTNRWKRWSGITRGGCSSGSTIDLVMHHRDNDDFTSAVEWLTQNFL